MARQSVRRSLDSYLGIILFAIPLIIPFLALGSLPQGELPGRALNVFTSLFVLIQGSLVCRAMWQIERNDRGIFPLASCYFAVQHTVFGLGGFLVSVFDAHYSYANDHGVFFFSDQIVPLLLAHTVCLNAGLAGVWLATRRARRRRVTDASALRLSRMSSWSWHELRPICLVSLAAHGVATVMLMLFENRTGVPFLYPLQAMTPFVGTAFLFWGLAWRTCTSKAVLFTYSVCFLATEVIRGQRGNFLNAGVLFCLGLLISQGGAVFSGFSRVQPLKYLKWIPLFVVLFWCVIRAEDMRNAFSRGLPETSAEAIARVNYLAEGGSSGSDMEDSQGNSMNSAFRFAIRICEVSAMDVIARTPSSVPFWGWQPSDWNDLLIELLPVKIGSGSGGLISDTAGVLFLRDYGWNQVDPERGNAMPATLIADCWRRYGWAGIVSFFFVWGWALTKMSGLFRNPNHKFTLIFAAAMVPNTALLYSQDLIDVVATFPRRLLLAAAYALAVNSLALLIATRRSSAPRAGLAASGPARVWFPEGLPPAAFPGRGIGGGSRPVQ